MARPLRIEYPGAFYHVIQRGIERRSIFASGKNKEKFFSYLSSAYSAYKAVFHTYILMGNHYHLILETPHSNLSKIMHYLNTSYAIYYNSKHKRVGPLFQGRYKAILIEKDTYLHHLSRYIHLNPVRSKIAESPEEYEWSSYRYFTQNLKVPPWLCTDFILSMFSQDIMKARRLYAQFVLDGMNGDKDAIIKESHSSPILGSQSFCEDIREKITFKPDAREIPDLKKIYHDPSYAPEDIKECVNRYVPADEKLRRKIAIYLLRKYTEKTLNQIAGYFGNIKYAAVSQICRRTEKQRSEDNKLDKLIMELERRLKLT